MSRSDLVLRETEFLLYETEDGRSRVEVRFDGDTAWLSLGQLATLFQRDKCVISRHIKNVFDEGELTPGATVARSATVQREGDREVTRDVEYFNLDVIISVGYRVKSHRGNQFHIWATQRRSGRGRRSGDRARPADRGAAAYQRVMEVTHRLAAVNQRVAFYVLRPHLGAENAARHTVNAPSSALRLLTERARDRVLLEKKPRGEFTSGARYFAHEIKWLRVRRRLRTLSVNASGTDSDVRTDPQRRSHCDSENLRRERWDRFAASHCPAATAGGVRSVPGSSRARAPKRHQRAHVGPERAETLGAGLGPVADGGAHVGPFCAGHVQLATAAAVVPMSQGSVTTREARNERSPSAASGASITTLPPSLPGRASRTTRTRGTSRA